METPLELLKKELNTRILLANQGEFSSIKKESKKIIPLYKITIEILEREQKLIETNAPLVDVSKSVDSTEHTLFAFAKFAMPTNYKDVALKNIIKQFIKESSGK